MVIKDGSESVYRIRLRFYSSIREAAGKSEDETEIPAGCTVFGLLEALSSVYGGAFRDEVFLPGDGGLREDIIVSVNGETTGCADAKDAIVGNGSVVDLFTTFPGGG